MRIFSAYFAAILLLSFATSPAAAAITAPVTTAHVEAKPVSITPHRAIYNMRLASVKNGSNVADVSGKMIFDWNDVCDGWAIEQHMKLHFIYAEGDESDVTSTNISWEAKDGKKYNFDVRDVTDGKMTDEYKGRATLGDNGGSVVYEIPKGKTMKLPAGTIFPSAHTELIIRNALAGDKLFSRTVFDGSDDNGYDDISAFVNSETARLQDASLDKLKHKGLLEEPAWPVRLAFFKTGTDTVTPDYEMDMDLQSNGIVRKMTIDYGDFTVTGTLSEIEALPKPGC